MWQESGTCSLVMRGLTLNYIWDGGERSFKYRDEVGMEASGAFRCGF